MAKFDFSSNRQTYLLFKHRQFEVYLREKHMDYRIFLNQHFGL